MEFIHKRVKKYRKKPSLCRRIFNHHVDKEDIQRCRDSLRESLDLFGVSNPPYSYDEHYLILEQLQSNIELRKQIAALSGEAIETSTQPDTAPSLPNLPTNSTHPHPSQKPQHLPAPPSAYNYVQGDVNTTVRDDSFNVSGTGNNISFSFAR